MLSDARTAKAQGRRLDAVTFYRQAIAETPTLYDAHFELGCLLGDEGDIAGAVREISAALELRPSEFEAWCRLSSFADELGQFELSGFAGHQATLTKPEDPRGWFRLGLSWQRKAETANAETAYRHALSLNPHYAPAAINLSVILRDERRIEEAKSVCRMALGALADETDPKRLTLLHWHLALSELTLGHYLSGFAHLAARYQGGTDWRRFESNKPLWAGEDPYGKTVLVRVEQGHGDALMLSRYLPLLKARGARVLFQTHPALVPFFDGWEGADAVMAMDQHPQLDFDYHTTIFDLPLLFKTDIATIPSAMPYLPRPAVTPADETSGLRRIGLVWSGQPHHSKDAERSFDFQLLEPLLEVPGTKFVSLNREMKPGNIERLSRLGIQNLGAVVNNFKELGDIVLGRGLLITCDTAAAHLAGGLNRPAWVLLPFNADWRWLLDRDDSPWYPSLRLFRQPRKGDWMSVIDRVQAALRDQTQKFQTMRVVR